MWWLYALLSAFFAALTAVLAKVGIRGVDSDLATAVRAVVILFIAWGIVLVKSGTSGVQTLSKSNLLFLVLSGIATGLSWLFYFRALQLGTVAQVTPIDRSSVAIAILLAAVFLHEPLTFRTALGAGLVIAGTIVIALR